MKVRSCDIVVFWGAICAFAIAGCGGPAAQPGGPGAPGVANPENPGGAPAAPPPLMAPKEAFALAVFQAESLRANPDLKPLLDLYIRDGEASRKELDLLTLVEAQASSSPPIEGEEAPTAPCVVAIFKTPADASKLAATFGGLQQAEHGGKSYRKGSYAEAFSIYQPDAKTVVVAPERIIKSFIESSTPPKALADALNRPGMTGQFRMAVLPGTQQKEVEQLSKLLAFLPPPVKRLFDLPKYVTSSAWSIHVGGDKFLHIELDTTADGAKEVQSRLDSALKFANVAVEEMVLPKLEDDPTTPPEFKEIAKSLVDESLGKIQVSVEGAKVIISLSVSSELAAKVRKAIPIAIAGYEKAQEAARVFQDLNNLKQLHLAAIQYHDLMNKLPDDIRDANGNSLLSWRVTVLPNCDEFDLYQKFDQKLAWDAAPNRLAAATLPGVFRLKSAAALNTSGIPTTRILRFVGPGTLFDGVKPMKFADIKDGASNTILYVQAGPSKAVPWTQPSDLPFDPKDPIKGLGDIRPEGFLAVFCDGGARIIPASIKPEQLAALITPNGAEPPVDLTPAP